MNYNWVTLLMQMCWKYADNVNAILMNIGIEVMIVTL